MSTKIWMGGIAAAAAHVLHITPANVEEDDIFVVDLSDAYGRHSAITFTATAANVANVTAGLHAAAVAAKAAGFLPWASVTSSDETTYQMITADASSVPYYATCTATDGGVADTQTLVATVATEAAGPNTFPDGENYADGTDVAGSDDLVLGPAVTEAITAGRYTAAAIDTLIVEPGCSLNIGAAADGMPGYLELDLTGEATRTVDFAGTGTCYLDLDGVAVFTVTDCGTAASAGTYPLAFRGLNCEEFRFNPPGETNTAAIAPFAGDTAEVDHIYVTNGSLIVGANVTEADGATAITSLAASGGSVECHSLVITVTAQGTAEITYDAPGTTVTVTVWSGATVTWAGTGTITTLIVAGTFDTSGGSGTFTVTNCTVYAGAVINDPDGRMTLTNGIDRAGCAREDVTIVRPPDETETYSAI
ncbi:MAG TPA: hypothetical protein VMW52_13460 [Phycisphaerae bacterium]|nr:hypothetical protein [Phycisphaerae bacterium]